MTATTDELAGTIGWRYHESAGTRKHGPTLDKPQTKFWRFDDAWWGVLAKPHTGESDGYSVFRFDEDLQQFFAAGDVETASSISNVDAHIDGEDLFIAARAPGLGVELRRLHYDGHSGRFVADNDAVWNVAGVETPSVSVTTSRTGKVVLTYATDRPLYAVAAPGEFFASAVPQCIPGAAPGLLEVDLSAAVTVGDDVALLWSDQRQETMFCMMLRPDGSMSREIAFAGGLAADDHIAARVFEDRLYVAVKTSRDDDPERASDDSLLVLLVREPDGTWHHHTVARTSEPVTRPMPLLEPELGLVHVLYTRGPNPGERSIHARSAHLNDLEFAAKQTTVMAVPGGQLNDVTGAREPLTRHTGALVAASDGLHQRYHFAWLRSGFATPSGPPV